MTRILRVAAVQVGRIDRGTPLPAVVERLSALLEEVHKNGVKLAVFPETTLSTFFPRYYITDEEELASYFVKEPADGIAGAEGLTAFFARAKELEIDVAIGYGEESAPKERYNTASYVSGGKTIDKYRKVHLPGTIEPFSADNSFTNQLEKRYFTPGNLGFRAFRAPALKGEGWTSSPIVGQLICNDRRWAEAWRAYGLQGTEIVCCGFNTTAWAPELWGIDPESMTREEAYADAMFHHKLSCQHGAYTNSLFCITSARCGNDDGRHPLISGSLIIDPEGHIVAENKTEEDEVVWADIDLDACKVGKGKTFNFGRHRQVEHYQILTEQAGVVEPPEP